MLEVHLHHITIVSDSHDLMKSSEHIEKVIHKQPKDQILKNRLRLKATIESVRWLTFQACAFRGNDESIDSMNRGNFIELIKYTAQWNDKVAEVVLENAPRNAKYTAPSIQKQVLHILADKVINKIRDKVGESTYCILVDEAKDASNREQMAIVLRFVDKDGFVRERYDGSSNKRALVAASKDVALIWLFFSTLNSIINLITASPKRHGELQSTQEIDIARMVDVGERETVVETLIKDGASNSIRGEATGTFKAMTSYEFIFILNLLEKIMRLTDSLCRALQNKSQDILTAMNLVRSTKDVLQKLRLEGWDTFFEEVESFCKKHDIDMPDMNAPYNYKVGTRHSCQQRDDITIEHHYRVDLFNDTIDYQCEELNSRFIEGTMELLILSSALDPSDGFKSFKIDDICKLAEKFYPQDFTVKELRLLRQLNDKQQTAKSEWNGIMRTTLLLPLQYPLWVGQADCNPHCAAFPNLKGLDS
ncbi:hypothetical protein L3X38_037843 [Prunus dulcis]|uniref:DUF4371 domain-containing protein n=1 Tax=Prunus dulcis TaxID=3755 RepID=A0AAD4V3X0_PRUDU|nr:hypothetical protein L3X38_037843 [Prunus dulcis]